MSAGDLNNLKIIGSTEFVCVAGIENIPAKIDTGADSSSIWASDISMEQDGTLTFKLLNPKSPAYTGEVLRSQDFVVRKVRSSHGDDQIRYRVKLPIVVNGESFETTFTLADRSRNSFPILIGRRTIEGKFLVDVSRATVKRPRPSHSVSLNEELKKDPYAFHQKYVKN